MKKIRYEPWVFVVSKSDTVHFVTKEFDLDAKAHSFAHELEAAGCSVTMFPRKQMGDRISLARIDDARQLLDVLSC